MEKILVQRLATSAHGSTSVDQISVAIAERLRLTRGDCEYVIVRANGAEHVNLDFIQHIEGAAVVVDLDVEAPPAAQSHFDYVVTVRPGDPAFQSFVSCDACGARYGRAAHGQFVACACGYVEPPTMAPPRPRERVGGVLRRFLKYRPFGQPASA